MEKLYKNPLIFKARILEELRRARRYTTFVSVLALDFSHVDIEGEIENYRNFEEFLSSIRKLIEDSIRETDLIGSFDRHRVSILLMDTSREGAAALASRLKESLRYFLCDNIKSPLNWRVPVKEYCYPSPSGEDLSIQTFLEE